MWYELQAVVSFLGVGRDCMGHLTAASLTLIATSEVATGTNWLISETCKDRMFQMMINRSNWDLKIVVGKLMELMELKECQVPRPPIFVFPAELILVGDGPRCF